MRERRNVSAIWPPTTKRILLTGWLVLAFAGSVRAGVVFSDHFSTSSLNTVAITPTGTSTTYEIDSNTAATSSISPGHLVVTSAIATSITEAQTRFTTVPITLALPGDFIEYAMTFTENNVAASLGEKLYFGLYNTGGVSPLSGLQTSGLNNTSASAFATGGSQLWQGYNFKLDAVFGGFFTRPQQNAGGTTSSNQDVAAALGAIAGAYHNPTGASVPGTSEGTAITAGTYTERLRITLNSDGSETLSSDLFQGTDFSGSVINSTTSVAASPLTYSFDGLAFGWFHSVSSNATSSIDATALSVTTGNSPAPEPASLAVMLFGGLLLLRRRRL